MIKTDKCFLVARVSHDCVKILRLQRFKLYFIKIEIIKGTFIFNKKTVFSSLILLGLDKDPELQSPLIAWANNLISGCLSLLERCTAFLSITRAGASHCVAVLVFFLPSSSSIIKSSIVSSLMLCDAVFFFCVGYRFIVAFYWTLLSAILGCCPSFLLSSLFWYR